MPVHQAESFVNGTASEQQPLLNHESNESQESSRLEAAFESSQHNGNSSPQPSQDLNALPETATIGRNLTWTSAYLLTISRIVGSGIFATPGTIYSSVGSSGLSIIVWIVGSLLAFCGLAISMELGCMLPRSGGVKVYLEFMYPRPRFLASTMVAIHAVVLGFTASNCIVFGEYMLVAFGKEVTPFRQRMLATSLLTTITVVHGCFMRTGIVVQNIFAWVKIALMASMAVMGIVTPFLPRHVTHEDADIGSNGGLLAGSNWELVALSTAIFKVSYSFAGYDNVNNVLNEVKNPVRTLKTMAPSALLTVAIFYLMINAAYFLVVPLDEINHSRELIAALFF